MNVQNHSMSTEMEIFQIIRWEERHKYFYNQNYPKDGEYDLIHFRNLITPAPWHDRAYVGLFKWAFKKKTDNGLFSYRTFLFENRGAMWIKRPHNYKKGDIITIEASVKPNSRTDNQ